MRYRSELKFILSYQTAEMIKRRISKIMAADKHSDEKGVYIVNNLYLDDQYDTFYHEKQIGKHSRDKYRVRYYNGDLSYVCFENKHKDGQLSYKTKAVLTKDELDALRAGDFSFMDGSDNPLWQTVLAIHNARRLRITAAFSYTREAYVYVPGDVRITFDSAIRPEKTAPMANSDLPLGLDPLMELKFTNFLPTVIADMIHSLPLVRTELSKYCYMREQTQGSGINTIH